MLCNFYILGILDIFRRKGNHKPKCFDFGIEYKSTDTKIFGIREETDIWISCCVFKVLEYIFYYFFTYITDENKYDRSKQT